MVVKAENPPEGLSKKEALRWCLERAEKSPNSFVIVAYEVEHPKKGLGIQIGFFSFVTTRKEKFSTAVRDNIAEYFNLVPVEVFIARVAGVAV